MPLSRREFIQWMSAGAGLATFAGCAGSGGPIAGRVVVIGGGYAGATAAKYVRLWAPDIEVTLVERNREFISCPLSNLVLGGSKTLADITVGYDGLAKYGVNMVRDDAVAIDLSGAKCVLRPAPRWATTASSSPQASISCTTRFPA